MTCQLCCTHFFSKLLDVVTLLPNDTADLLALHDESDGKRDRRTAISIQDNFVLWCLGIHWVKKFDILGGFEGKGCWFTCKTGKLWSDYGQITNPVDVRLLRGNRCEGKVIYDLDGVFSSFKKQEPSWEECRVCGSQTVVNSGSRWEEAFEEEKWEWVYAERILFEKTKGRDKRMQREKNMTMMLPAETRRRRRRRRNT